MRVTNRSTTRNYLKYMNKALTDQANISQRMESNNRFERISDDVSSGVQAMKARTDLSKTEKQLSTVSAVSDQVSSAESSLTSIGDLISNIRPKIQKALNGTNAAEDRKILSTEIGTMKKEILEFLNTQYSGQFLFGGTNNFSPPFSIDETSGELKYNSIPVNDIKKNEDGSYYYLDENNNPKDIPMDGDVYLDIGLGVRLSGAGLDAQSGFKVSYSGLDIVGFGADENGMSNNIYNILNSIEKELVSDSYVKETVEKYSSKLNKLNDSFRTNITDLGARSQFLETMKGRLESSADNLDAKITNLTGTDFGEETIHQATNTAVLNAIYRLGSNVIPLSLMDFLT